MNKHITAPIIKIFNTKAITLYKWVIFAEKNPSDELINHEQIHLDQISRDGVLKFYSKYLFEYVSLRFKGLNHYSAYMGISYEIEAYANEHNLDYKVNSDKVEK
jgi:hypothetical protein